MGITSEVFPLILHSSAFVWSLRSLRSESAVSTGPFAGLSISASRVFICLYCTWKIVSRCFQVSGKLLGWHLRLQTSHQRQMLFSKVEADKEARESTLKPGVNSRASERLDNEQSQHWRGIIGFFHPFCNAGGGGERVLWAGIRATQNYYPAAICIVYTGDHEAKAEILRRMTERFNIQLDESRVFFRYLSARRWVLASTWPHFTLLGQSIGSLVLAMDAFSLLVPDIFIDTMGYAYALALAKFCFPDMPTGAYVHYPTISTDMLGSLDMEPGKGLHAGAGKGVRGQLKRKYWQLFARTYSWAGGHVDTVMTNSSWTQGHIATLWEPARVKRGRTSKIKAVFPPVAVKALEDAVSNRTSLQEKRQDVLVCIAQFRPEKNHTILIEAFAQMVQGKEGPTASRLKNAKLILIGSVRDSDDAKRVYELRLTAHELKVRESVEFICDAPWPEILDWLGKSSVGVNGMWNEHFGIGVVEYQAAGLICVVNDSGGPKWDIVVDVDGGPTGEFSKLRVSIRRRFALNRFLCQHRC